MPERHVSKLSRRNGMVWSKSHSKTSANGDAGNRENVSPFQTPLTGPVGRTNDDTKFSDLNGIVRSRFIGSRGLEGQKRILAAGCEIQ